VQEAKRRGYDGIICGHIHHPALQERDGICYVNDGDWVEHGTAVFEHLDGHLELHWADEAPAVQPAPRLAPAMPVAALRKVA
jgi:UDP-2,3-diacylglucosamine pyrophosphatase LpxH